LLRHVLAYAKAAYRTGNLTFVQNILQDYDSVLGTYGTVPDAWSLDFQQAKTEIQGMRHRLSANLDYFWHPAGWVPLISLEGILSGFSNEVDASVPLIVLSQYANAKATQNQKGRCRGAGRLE